MTGKVKSITMIHTTSEASDGPRPSEEPSPSAPIRVFHFSFRSLDLLISLRQDIPVRITLTTGELLDHGNPGSLPEPVKDLLLAILHGSASYCGPLPDDCSDFKKSVLEAARRIPWGEKRTYEEIARDIGRPKGGRAVGQALGKNPLPLLIPCHRILGKGCRLTGYSFGGVGVKEILLSGEKKRTVL